MQKKADNAYKAASVMASDKNFLRQEVMHKGYQLNENFGAPYILIGAAVCR